VRFSKGRATTLIKLTQDKIREEAEHFRKEHIFSSALPVGIEHVDEDPLVEEFKSKRQAVLKKYSSWNSPKIIDDDLFSMVAPLICGRFDVSSGVIERRLRKENIMSLPGK
jgi:hypothetical protein